MLEVALKKTPQSRGDFWCFDSYEGPRQVGYFFLNSPLTPDRRLLPSGASSLASSVN